jgi:hypothetical protein
MSSVLSDDVELGLVIGFSWRCIRAGASLPERVEQHQERWRLSQRRAQS